MAAGPFYHINIPGACFTHTTNDQALAAFHQVHGAEVWATRAMSPEAPGPWIPDLRTAYRYAGSPLCTYCGFGNPCTARPPAP